VGVTERRGVRGQHDVAAHQQFQATGGARAVHRRDDRQRRRPQPAQEVRERPQQVADEPGEPVGRVQLREEVPEVGARAERRARTGDHHRPDLTVRIGPIQCRVQFGDHVRCDGIASGRPVQREPSRRGPALVRHHQ
jgi:hypothetical protein